jgi:hypothetical protein
LEASWPVLMKLPPIICIRHRTTSMHQEISSSCCKDMPLLL